MDERRSEVQLRSEDQGVLGLAGTAAGAIDGFPVAGGRASLSTKHTLAITNRGTATAADILAIARTVRDGVEDTFGIRLHPEPLLINCGL